MTEITERLSTAIADRYRIERHLGAGGMATVYLAHDLKHDRKVALKVLRPELAAVIGAERFLNEIKVTANLQHPNILALYDSGEADSFLFYVMPYIDGESLRDKIDREKQLAVDDAVEIIRGIGSALDYAHGKGVIHRDIKPENILLQDKRPMVADFGIALAVSAAGGTRLTETGLSIGTPHYMSPEQAMGDRELDARSDVYSLGAMLYELLVGEPPFTGPTAQSIVAKVITEKAPLVTAARDTVPRHVALTVYRALAKLPADRYPSAIAFTESLVRPRTADTDAYPLPPGETFAPPAAMASRASRTLPLVLGALLVVASGAALWGWLGRPSEVRMPIRFTAALPEQSVPILGPYQSMALSPDGQRVVYVGAGTGGIARLYVRDLGRLTPQPIAGTDRAVSPSFSPDGAWIVFVAGDRVRKVPVEGGPPVALGDSAASIAQSTAWLDDGSIAYVRNASFEVAVIPENGGPPLHVYRPDSSAVFGFSNLTPLPGGRGLVAVICSVDNCEAYGLGVVDFRTDSVRVLIPDAVGGWYLPTGHLVYAQSSGAVFAQPFDLGTLELSGSPVPLLEGVRTQSSFFPQLAIGGRNLVYLAGDGAVTNQLVLVERDGTERPLSDQLGDFQDPKFSPDGRRVAVELHDEANIGHIWVYDMESRTLARVTFEGHDARPVWTPDGRQIAFSSARAGGWKAYITPADGSGTPRLLFDATYYVRSKAFTPDGRTLVYNSENDDPGMALYAVPVDGGAPTRLVETNAREWAPLLSPDGRWLAYVSDESGRNEVYVRSFANPGGRWLVSVGGGSEPTWGPRGRELFYRATDGMTVATVEVEPIFRVVSRRPLFDAAPYRARSTGVGYDVHPDGQRFVLVRVGQTESDPIVVVNWLDEVRERMAGTGR